MHRVCSIKSEPKYKLQTGLQWCVNIGSLILTNVLLWWGMLIMGEAMNEWGRHYMGNLCASAWYCWEPKLPLKINLLKISWQWGFPDGPVVKTLHFHCRRHQFSSVAQSCPTLCHPMNCSTPGLPVHHQLLEFMQTHVHQVSEATQPSHPLPSPSPPSLNLSPHQGLFKSVRSSHQVAEVLEFQLQHQSFQWTPRTDLL